MIVCACRRTDAQFGEDDRERVKEERHLMAEKSRRRNWV